MNTVTLVQDTQWRFDDVCASTKFPDYLALLPLLVGAFKHMITETMRLQRLSTFVQARNQLETPGGRRVF